MLPGPRPWRRPRANWRWPAESFAALPNVAVVDAWLLDRETASTAAEELPDTYANRARRGRAYPGPLSSVTPDTDRGG